MSGPLQAASISRSAAVVAPSGTHDKPFDLFYVPPVYQALKKSVLADVPLHYVQLALKHVLKIGHFPISKLQDGRQVPQPNLHLFAGATLSELPMVAYGIKPAAFGIKIGPKAVSGCGHNVTPVFFLCRAHVKEDGSVDEYPLHSTNAYRQPSWVCSHPFALKTNPDTLYVRTESSCVSYINNSAIDVLMAAMRGTPDCSYETLCGAGKHVGRAPH